MTVIKQHFQQALANIRSSKLRSFLAMLGILVGTAAVVALISIGELATHKALQQFKALGTDLLAISLFQTSTTTKNTSDAKVFSLPEANLMSDTIPTIKAIAPYISLYGNINYETHKINGSIAGVVAELQPVIKIKLSKGRFISPLDRASYYCVVGHDIAQDMKRFSYKSIVGNQILLGNTYFTVVGVAEKWQENTFFNQNVNRLVMIPILTSKVIRKNAQIHNIIMRIKPNINITHLTNDIKAFVSLHSPFLQVFPRSAKQIIESMKQSSQIFTLLLGFIGGISLLVGGIGVMNVMIASVAERHREIGIRMAIGANRKDIQLLFLTESIILALLGGILGVILGISTSLIISYFVGWGYKIFWIPPIIGFGVSAATGVFFGYYPAYRASRLDPIQTLRYD